MVAIPKDGTRKPILTEGALDFYIHVQDFHEIVFKTQRFLSSFILGVRLPTR